MKPEVFDVELGISIYLLSLICLFLQKKIILKPLNSDQNSFF